MCMTYNVIHGTTYGIRYETRTCQDCENRSCGRKTCRDCEDPYTCYRGVVLLNYGEPDDNCEYNDRKKKFRSEQARDDYYNEEYPLGSTHNFLVKERDEENADVRACTKIEKGMATWIAGVVFICLSAVTLIGWIIYGCVTYDDWKTNTIYAPPPATRFPGRRNGTYNIPPTPSSPYAPAHTHIEMVSAPSNTYYPAGTYTTNRETAYSNGAPYPTSVSESPYNPQYTPSGTPDNTSSFSSRTPYAATTPYAHNPSDPVSYHAPVATHSAYEDYEDYDLY